jgi:N utilization substance protein A
MVVSELRGEKIDIIPYNEEPARFVAKALSPARVREVLVDDEKQESTVIVPDDQLSLAIGREGQNARLAAKLTGWKVDIKSETEFSQEDEELTYEDGEDVDGRCAAVLSAGRRCPNASLQGSRYCGLPQHQALARFETNQVTVLAALSEDEVSRLADPNGNEGDLRPLVERAMEAFESAQPAAEPEGPELDQQAEDAESETDAADGAAEAGEELDPEQALAEDAATEGDQSEEAPPEAPTDEEATADETAGDADQAEDEGDQAEEPPAQAARVGAEASEEPDASARGPEES